jgi:nicotinate-nucleotide adenylyltransferase
MRIGILGGSFDPVHRGHLAMAEAARDAHGLEPVLLVPAAKPPHKAGDQAPPADRLAMVEIAARGRRGLAGSDLEIRRGGVSYTVETLEELKKRHPGAELFFILGEDSFPEFFGWRNVERILELARVVTVNRPGWKVAFQPERFPGASPAVLARLERDRVTMPGIAVESRRIREAVRAGKPIAEDVPPGVEEYIRERGLYRD